MNAVKRCLALIAATLVVGACSGDPTADKAGADLTIRATPGAVWVRHDLTAAVLLEAIDGTGGTQPGTWTAGSIVGPLVATRDTSYLPNYTGTSPNAQQWIISSTAEGEGSVTFSGTGGSTVIQVRVAPAPDSFHVVFSNLNPVIAEVITATAPAGMRFTEGTTIEFVAGATNTTNNGLAAPSITGYNVDSTVMSILPAPGAAGRISFTGIATINAPELVSDARSKDSVTVPVLSTVAAVFTPSTTPAVNAALTITMPANFKFRPTSAFSIAGAPLAPIVLSRSADSNSVVILPAPGSTGAVSITNVRFAPLGSLSLTLPTSSSITIGAATDLGSDDPTNGGNPSFAVPNVTGTTTAWYELGTFAFADPTSSGCDNQGGTGNTVWQTVTVANAGSYTFRLNWTGGSDLDFALAPKDGSYGGAGCGEFDASSLGGLNVNKPETFTIAALAAGTYVLYIKDYPDDQSGTGIIQVWVTKN